MSTFCKRALIACLLTLPQLAFAADNTGETKPATATSTTIQAEPAAAATAVTPSLNTTRIGYVDFTRIGTESERGKALKALLTAKKDELQKKVDGKKKQVEKLKTSIEAKIALLTPKQREARSKEFEKKVEEFRKFAQGAEEELMTLQEKETKSLFDAIEQTAVDHGKKEGFAAIVIKKELLYVGSAVDAQDVTDALIKTLNQSTKNQ